MFFELNSRRLSRNVRALVEPNGINAKDVALMLDRFAAQLDKLFQPKTILVETPFLSVNKYGQRTSGYIDLLLETSKGGVIIDHKSFLGKRTDWPVKALSYSGQLAAYRGARHTSAICVCRSVQRKGRLFRNQPDIPSVPKSRPRSQSI